MSDRSAIIIGGGIIGLCSAYYLVNKGWRVTVLERSKENFAGTSYGNAGLIVPSHFVPIASRGMMTAGLKMALNPTAAFGARPMTPGFRNWAMRSSRFALSDHASRVAPYIRDLNLLSQGEYDEMLPAIGMPDHPKKRGLYMVAESQNCMDELAHFQVAAMDLGLESHLLNREEVSDQLSIEINSFGGVHFLCDSDLPPHQVMEKLKTYLSSAGVDLHYECEVQDFKATNGKIRAVRTNKGDFSADEFVLAAGSWTGKLASLLHLNLPMLPGKGHSMTVTGLSQVPSAPILLEEGKIAINPMVDGVRISGNFVLGDWGSKPIRQRITAVQRRLQKVIPAWQSHDFGKENIWVGFRPCTPDGLPYLGRAKVWENLTLAAGHAMMGMSLGPATGRLVSQILTGEKTSLPISALSPERKI
ncbi:MAG: FAD-binding oxidoreductase [Fimbriimonadaceae bacterium]|nr:FAD-binding oxidoreductase [Fimbriimonadaceae bacterium]